MADKIYNNIPDMLNNEFKEEKPEQPKVETQPQPKVEQQAPISSLKDRRKQWRIDSKNETLDQEKKYGELYNRFANGEISRKEYNKLYKDISQSKVGPYPKRDRVELDDLIDAKRNSINEVMSKLNPLIEEDKISFNKNFMYGTPYDKNKNKEQISNLSKQRDSLKNEEKQLRKQRALEFAKTFNRQDYSKAIDNFYNNSEEFNKLTGNDRMYALFQFADEYPTQDINKVLSDDIIENREKYPDYFEFEDELYQISPSGNSYEQYRKNEDGKWQRVLTGTIYGLGDELIDKLEAENFNDNPKYDFDINDEDSIFDAWEKGKITEGQRDKLNRDRQKRLMEQPKETRYPKGTSKDYTEQVNQAYQNALPILAKYGIKPEDFGVRENEQGGYEDNSREILYKYVFDPFQQKYPYGNNEAWDREYKELYNAIDAVLDKNYNDYWIKKAPMGY